ncbi:Hypothetical protein PBC10988_38540 [Planctomycetales bacterium 10988]|nr:Hypothetical protein PBC10988_38540 [Planctomycetales bacterium 10988]
MTTSFQHAIPGICPSAFGETTLRTIRPTIGAFVLGRMLGRIYEIVPHKGPGFILTARNLVMIATLPLAALLTIVSVLPGIAQMYKLTNRRLVIFHPFSKKERVSIPLHRFDTVDTSVVLPGQSWYPCGEIIFRLDGIETFRFSGVARHRNFAKNCLDAQRTYQAFRALRQAETLQSPTTERSTLKT